MTGKLPAIQFYVGDWLRDNVAGCSLAAQGLWLRIILLAHESERYGYLAVNGSAMEPSFVARKCGSTLAEYETLLAELDSVNVPSRTPDGIIFSRRMVRDAKARDQAKGRQQRHRDKTPLSREESRSCHGDVTRSSHDSSSSSSSSASAVGGIPPTPPGARVETPKKSKPSDTTDPPGFVSFWKVFPSGPRKVDRAGCLRIWRSKGLEAESSSIVAGLTAWVGSQQWTKDGGAFVCMSTTFLNQRRWETTPTHAGDIGNPDDLKPGWEISDDLKAVLDGIDRD